jgi:hypothetical protein
MSVNQEQVACPKESTRMGMAFGPYNESVCFSSVSNGKIIFEMRDAESGALLAYWERCNIITKDAGILAARLFKNSQDPVAGRHNGVNMLAIGTGATGNLLSPDAPQATQRKLNTEIARKAFVSTQYRNGDGVAVAYPTNIVDFTTTFGESEAVGPLNEMGLMSAYSINPLDKNPINNGPDFYDSTIDVTGKDLLANYLSFGVIVKPATAIVTISWRFTF